MYYIVISTMSKSGTSGWVVIAKLQLAILHMLWWGNEYTLLYFTENITSNKKIFVLKPLSLDYTGNTEMNAHNEQSGWVVFCD